MELQWLTLPLIIFALAFLLNGWPTINIHHHKDKTKDK